MVAPGWRGPRKIQESGSVSASVCLSVLLLNFYSTREELEMKTTTYDTFNHNIRMLNESMGMCIPAMTVRDPT